MHWHVPLSDLDYGEAEQQAVQDVLQSRWLTMGQQTELFESQFSDLIGARYALAVSNATAALHLACLALGIGPGDEVILPSLTFVATANAVCYTGARVIFADILSPSNLTISPGEIERMITPRTRAILAVHYAGYPCCMPEIMQIASSHHLAVIEDSAHAPGASLNGISLGVYGDVGCFSFFSNKNLSTGEGGMLVTNNEDIYHRARLMRSHGMTSLTWDRHQGHAYSYDVVELGYNYRIDEIHSALGIVQLSKLAQNNACRKKITHLYWEALNDTLLRFPFRDIDSEPEINPSYHIFPVLLPEQCDRLSFIEKLRQSGIQTSIHYPPIHQFSYYRRLYPDLILPLTEYVASKEVTLPLFPCMTSDQLSHVVETIYDTLKDCQSG